MGKLVLLSNFRDGYPEMIKKVADKESVIFSYIPSRTEFGEIYYNRVMNLSMQCVRGRSGKILVLCQDLVQVKMRFSPS